MSVKQNIIANYGGQLYVALAGFVLVPVYVKYMGAEAYGLVGFYAMMQAWFFLLDMGLTPTMARETARFQGGGVMALNLRKLVRAFEAIFVAIAVLGAAAIVFSAETISTQWLKPGELSVEEVNNSLTLMAFIIAFRWMGGLYRSAITGFERLVWLNIVNIIFATFRFVVVVPILIYIDSSPTTFFAYQLLITVIEFVVFSLKSYRLLPDLGGARVDWDFRPLRDSLKFSLTVAFAGMVWVGVTQIDKLMLSGLISLEDYGYYMLAVLIASGLMIVSKPISGAVMPRMTRLNAESNEEGMFNLYRKATQVAAVATIPAAAILAVFPREVLYAWTGSEVISANAAQVLVLYALGNALMVFVAFPYLIQYAKGDLKIHLIGNIILGLFFVPLIIVLVNRFGALGAGYAWVIINLIFFLVYVPLVHVRFRPGMHFGWLFRDLGRAGMAPVVLILVIDYFVVWPGERILLALGLFALLAASGALAIIGAPAVRQPVLAVIGRFGLNRDNGISGDSEPARSAAANDETRGPGT